MGITDHIQAPAGASLAPTLVQRVLLLPNPPPITISKAFDLPGSSACAPLPKEQGPVFRHMWEKYISVWTLFRCVHLQQNHAPKWFCLERYMFECNPAMKLVSIRIRFFFPICPRRCTHQWVFAAPALRMQQGSEQNCFRKLVSSNQFFLLMTSFRTQWLYAINLGLPPSVQDLLFQ